MGGYTAVSDDAFGLDWNLAGTTFQTPNLEVTFGSNDIRYNSDLQNLRVLLHFGRHVIAVRHTPGNLQEHSFNVVPIPSPGSRAPLGIFHELYYQEDFSAGYAMRLFPNVAVGIDVRRNIFGNSFRSSSRFLSTTVNFFWRAAEKINLAVVARNVASYHYKKHIQYIRDYTQDPPALLPVAFDEFTSVFTHPQFRLDLGAAYQPWPTLLTTFDLYSDGGYGVGFEWQAVKGVFIRQGMSHKSDLLFKKEKVFGLAWGVGYKYHDLRLDVTYYFPYGHRNAVSEFTSFGEFSVDPRKNDKLMISALFLIR